MVKGVAEKPFAAVSPGNARTIPVTNRDLNRAGVVGLRIAPGASMAKVTAARLALRLATWQSFRPLLAIQTDTDFDLVIEKGPQFRRFVNQVKDPELRAFTWRALALAPNEFYLKPSALSSSVHHPADEFAVGGEALHTARTAELAARAYPLMFDGEDAPDCLLIGALLHDVGSNMEAANDTLVFDRQARRHGELTANWIRGIALCEFPHFLPKLKPVLSMVSSHMGRWEGFDLAQRGIFLDWLLSAVDIAAAHPRSYIDFPGAFPWANRELVFRQPFSPEKMQFIEMRVEREKLSPIEKKAIVIAYEMFRQCRIVNYGDMMRIVKDILAGKMYGAEEMVADKHKFIASFAFAAASCACLSIGMDVAELGVMEAGQWNVLKRTVFD